MEINVDVRVEFPVREKNISGLIRLISVVSSYRPGGLDLSQNWQVCNKGANFGHNKAVKARLCDNIF
jgi:hypothetical protein